MGRMKIVPMQDEGTALPVYTTSSPQFAIANSPVKETSYEVVELTDSNKYQSVRMVWTDIKSD